MTRLLLLSDSHGKMHDLLSIIEMHPEADRIIFLGDGAGEIESIRAERPELPIVAVKGNCDYGTTFERDLELVVCGKRILCTHGSGYGVKGGNYLLVDEAKERKCDAAFYGHTHQQYWNLEEGVWLVNPGAVSAYPNPQYGMVDITDDGKFIVNLCELK